MFNRRTRDGAHGVEWFYKALTQVVGLYKIMPRSSRSFLLFGKFDQIAIHKFLACFCLSFDDDDGILVPSSLF